LSKGYKTPLTLICFLLVIDSLGLQVYKTLTTKYLPKNFYLSRCPPSSDCTGMREILFSRTDKYKLMLIVSEIIILRKLIMMYKLHQSYTGKIAERSLAFLLKLLRLSPKRLQSLH